MADETLVPGAQPAGDVTAAPEAEPNPFADRLAKDPSLGEVGALDRLRLNAADSYYRGTIKGATERLGVTADPEGAQPIVDEYGRIVGEQAPNRKRLDSIKNDLTRYDLMRGFDTPLEATTALAGQLGGAMLSPESWITRVPGVASLVERLVPGAAGRVAASGASQAIVQGAANPAIQGAEIGAGVREHYSPAETAAAAGLGAVLGGGIHAAGEFVGAGRAAAPKSSADPLADGTAARAVATQQAAEARNMAALAAEDPSLRSTSTPEAPAPKETLRDGPAVDGGSSGSDVAVAPGEGSAPAVAAPEASERKAPLDGEAPPNEAAAELPGGLPLNPVPDAPRRQGGNPLSITQFIGKNGGLALDGEAAARDLGKAFVPGAGPLARKNGRTIDGFWRENLIEHGYLPPDAEGGAARDVTKEVFDAIDADRRGERVYSNHDTAPDAPLDSLHKEIEAEAKTIAKAHEAVGVSRDELDPRTLSDAAEMVWRGDEHDPLAAYERAAMMRELADEHAPGPRETFDTPPGWDDDALHGGTAQGLRDEARGAGGGGERPRPEGGPDRPGEQLPGAGEGSGGEGDIRFRKRTVPDSGQPGRPGTVAAAARADGSPEHAAVRSLQQQAQDLADALDVPLRQGRIRGGKEALGQFDTGQDVVRVRSVSDFETVAHEAGHALEKHVGPDLTALIRKFGAELAPLDYDPVRMDPGEGFAEWMRATLANPAYGAKQAPQFAPAFRSFMAQRDPEMLARLDAAAAAHQAWVAAPSGEKLEAIVRKPDDDGILASIRRDGLPATIRLGLSKAYEGLLDDKAPVTRAVRSMVRAIYAQTGERVRLEGADNPENLVRLFGRAQQAAVRDMLDGVRPYHGVEPQGPALADALSTAAGSPGLLGRWDEHALEAFDRYLVARRSEVLYRKLDAGLMERRPIAMSSQEVRSALAEAEAQNPTFRQAADMVHTWTRELLRKQYEGGLIERDLFDKLSQEEFYVPLFRHMDDKPSAGTGAGGADGPGTVDTIKKMKGSDRDIIPPTQGLMTQAFLVNRTLAHNDILKSFVALARQAREVGADGIGRILEEVPPTQMVGKRFDLQEAVQNAARAAGTDTTDMAVLSGALTDVFGEDPIMATIFRSEPTGKRGEPLVFYKDGGKLRAVRLAAKDEGLALYETLAGMPKMAQDWALKLGTASSGLLRTGIVTNPVFAVTNFVRDQLAVGILRSDYVPFVSGTRGLVSDLKQDQWAQRYVYGGGVSPGAGSAGLSELVKGDIEALARKGWAVQKLGGLADLATKGDVIAGAKAVAETVEAAESGTRLAVMKSVFESKKRQGLSDYDALIEAAAQSTDLMDFGRHGSGTLYIRTLVPFLNAHLQGLDKARRTLIEPLWRAATGDVVTHADAAALRNASLGLFKMVGVGGSLGVAYGMWASSHEAYRDANEEMRATHLILPGSAFGRDGKVLVIPKPFELAMGFNMGEALGLAIATGDPRAASFAIDGAREVLQPPNPVTGIPALKTAAELTLNRSFFTGRDIVPARLQNKDNPRFEVNPGTSALAKQVGNALNLSPIKIDYAVGNLFGMWGKDLLAASNTQDPNAPAAAQEDTMFLRRFIKAADRTSETTKAWWEMAAQQNGAFAQAKARYDDLTKSFKDGEAADYLGSLPDAQRAYVILNSAGDENGKGAFKADEKRINPLTRAVTAVQAVNGYVKELQANTQRTFEDGSRVAMDPQKRRDVIDAMRVLAAIEQRNALVMTNQPGYAGRPLLSAEDQFAIIRAQSPAAADELATRYATMKVYPTATVEKLWPEMQKRLLVDGSQADVRELGYDAKGDGWAFGGDAVKRPQKRRTVIDPSNPPPADRRVPMNRQTEPPTEVPNPF